ncbi:flagellar protein FliT [Nitrosomonas marina]|uniref:Flagellar protein FliT n=1 Tax=Nitrosomonas marina TaxID=917 RepID=A0A1I0EZF9_9PROT|nr:flagellar protein FliT [Nitrosomonas marina]SET50321.1 flagellar protein FliT [Nitrosomonas marina]
MDSKQLIKLYEDIKTITNKMVTAAENGKWDELIQLERQCRRLTDELIHNESQISLSHELQQKKIRIIHQVLNDDAQIRSITEPWMEKLQDMLHTNKRKRHLQQAYESSSIY